MTLTDAQRPGPDAPAGSFRQSAESMLVDAIERKRRELEGLEALHAYILDSGPLGHVADEALWKLFCDQRLR